MTPSRAVLCACLAFIAGIFVGSFFLAEVRVVLALMTGGLFLPAVFGRYRTSFVLALLVLAFAGGIVRHAAASEERRSVEPREASFEGRIGGEPQRSAQSLQLVVEPDGLSVGKVLVFESTFRDYRYGDRVRVAGTLEEPPVFEDFDYASYLAAKDIYSVMRYPEVEMLARGEHEGIWEKAYAGLLSAKQRFRSVLESHIAPPEGTILAALTLGDKRQIPDELGGRLNRAGVRHITAISGMHIVVASSLLLALFLGFGLWRKHAFWLVMVLLVCFIALTGFQTSAVRAGIMGGLFLGSQQVGRMNASLRMLVFAAAAMLALNPLLLAHDVGFQLSFLAVLGIGVLLPRLRPFLTRVPSYGNAREIAGMTIAAQAFTFPLLLFHFGSLSLVSLASNLLIVPVLPFLLGFGFLFLLGGFLWSPLGTLLAFPVSFLLEYLLFVVDFFSGAPVLEV